MSDIAAEIRAEFANIRKRYEGVCDAIAPIRVSRLEAIEKHITKLEANAKAPRFCSACGQHPEFALTEWLHEPSRSNPLAAAFAINATKGCL